MCTFVRFISSGIQIVSTEKIVMIVHVHIGFFVPGG